MPVALSTIPAENTDPADKAEKSTVLHFAYVEKDKAVYKFDPNELIVGKKASLVVSLEAGIPEGQPHDGKDIDLFSYCCTETELTRVRLISWSPDDGKNPQTHQAVLMDAAEQAKPLTDRKQPGQFVKSIKIDFALQDRQLVFVGVIVRVTIDAANGKYEYFLCDPQVGNGPPGAGKDWQAVLLPL